MSLKSFLIFTFCFGLLLVVSSILPMDAFAREELQSESALVIVMCNALLFFTGPLGRTFATLVVIAVGFGFFTGKLSWGTMIATALGIAVLFGAPTIINVITGSRATPCADVGLEVLPGLE